MKWMWVVLLAVLAPVSVQAAPPAIGAEVVIIGSKWHVKPQPNGLTFLFSAQDDGNYLKATFRFYVPKDFSGDPVMNAQCKLVVNNQVIHDQNEYSIFTEYGRELWFSSLLKKDRAGLNIVWGHDDPLVEWVSVAIESNQGTNTYLWKSAKANWRTLHQAAAEEKDIYRELSLDDVCGKGKHYRISHK